MCMHESCDEGKGTAPCSNTLGPVSAASRAAARRAAALSWRPGAIGALCWLDHRSEQQATLRAPRNSVPGRGTGSRLPLFTSLCGDRTRDADQRLIVPVEAYSERQGGLTGLGKVSLLGAPCAGALRLPRAGSLFYISRTCSCSSAARSSGGRVTAEPPPSLHGRCAGRHGPATRPTAHQSIVMASRLATAPPPAQPLPPPRAAHSRRPPLTSAVTRPSSAAGRQPCMRHNGQRQ